MNATKYDGIGRVYSIEKQVLPTPEDTDRPWIIRYTTIDGWRTGERFYSSESEALEVIRDHDLYGWLECPGCAGIGAIEPWPGSPRVDPCDRCCGEGIVSV